MSLSEFSLKGKKALVIGARRDMGKDFALGLAEAGADVAELIFEVSDLKKEIDRLVGKGTQILQISDDNKMASIGSGMKGNILTRLIQKS